MKYNSAKLQFIAAMLIFGTIGIFVKKISVSSGIIALVRGSIGALFLFTMQTLKGKHIDVLGIRKNLFMLILSGIFIGVNWILLFESYRYTTIAVSTLCYYLAPILVIIVSPIFFQEKITLKKGICIILTMLGAVLVSGVIGDKEKSTAQIFGVLLAIGSACFYAAVIVINKKITQISSYDKTFVQLASAAAVMIPYAFFNVEAESFAPDMQTVILLLTVGIVHTGFAYVMYFGSLEKMKAQTAAIFSYIDPVTAIVVSGLFMKEKINFATIIGAVLILGSALLIEQE